MPVNVTYPGIYIEELPSTARAITSAPTSITVFVGYSHPFKTTAGFGVATRIFGFSEYERHFGGWFKGLVPNDLPVAVEQFFLNGGADAYVVGLRPQFHPQGGGGGTNLAKDTATVGGVTFQAQELTGPGQSVSISIENIDAAGTSADFVFGYGSRSETWRGIKLAALPGALATSELVRVTGALPATLAAATGAISGTMGGVAPNDVVLATADFTAVFAQDGSLDKVEIFNLLCTPGVTDPTISAHAISFCERKRAFFIMDAPKLSAADTGANGLVEITPYVQGASVPKSPNTAVYFPWLKSKDPFGAEIEVAPSGFVAGAFARTDNNRGVWKAPAGLEVTLNNTVGVVERGRMTDMRAGVLNEGSVNAIRTFTGAGTTVFGARTLANVAQQQWRYVPVRRTALFIEQTLYRNLGWVIFEPNDRPLWTAITGAIDAFMLSLFRQGAFQGKSPSEAFLVRCDETTTTQQDIDTGKVNIVVGFRPLKPAEFVIVKITQLAGQAQA